MARHMAAVTISLNFISVSPDSFKRQRGRADKGSLQFGFDWIGTGCSDWRAAIAARAPAAVVAQFGERRPCIGSGLHVR